MTLDRELGAVVVEIEYLDVALVLSPDTTVDLILKLVGALSRLRPEDAP